MGIVLNKKQSQVVEMMEKNQIGILIGGPGTGKSTTLRSVVKWAESKNMKTLLASPTGKAAKRISETTERKATTIHAMLECIFNDKSGTFTFVHNEKKHLIADLIIIDECSMITNSLMCSVLKAIDIMRTKLLLVGDQNQLPSVGPGAVLRDFIASGIIPKIELTEIYRSGGMIVEACHDIKYGEVYQIHRKLDLDAEKPINLIHIECSTPEQTLDGVEALVCEKLPALGYKPEYDIQVISPVNTRGPLSCKAVNDRLRERLNPAPEEEKEQSIFNEWEEIDTEEKETRGVENTTQKDKEDKKEKEYPFRVKDKVINTKNNKFVAKDSNLQFMIVNGDIGFVTEVDKKNIVIRFTDPPREVIIPKNEKHLLHAYCITCHRFQGSEAPVIIIPLHRQFNFFLSNSWIYTAISRGKKIVITLGSFATIEKAIGNRQPNNRRTRLKEKLITAVTGEGRTPESNMPEDNKPGLQNNYKNESEEEEFIDI